MTVAPIAEAICKPNLDDMNKRLCRKEITSQNVHRNSPCTLNQDRISTFERVWTEKSIPSCDGCTWEGGSFFVTQVIWNPDESLHWIRSTYQYGWDM